ncbi:hypothetical protein niasHT_031484 [Heterodera trifolii]|uniref:F-box domain-containing protein n=1 Tax=Heterodera trifolii TaxID=157864 RepID=A0ABD2ISL8_9BILA
MATGIRLPQELLYDLLHFLSRSRRWARCRVNMAFDHHLLKQMGPWLMRVKQLVINNEESIQKTCDKLYVRITFLNACFKKKAPIMM